jgi:hypothetical protein
MNSWASRKRWLTFSHARLFCLSLSLLLSGPWRLDLLSGKLESFPMMQQCECWITGKKERVKYDECW